MKISMTDFLYALSFALDSIEHELVGATTHHSKRVAYISAMMGRQFDLSDQDLIDLACCAALHDNALTEYIKSEHALGIDVKADPAKISLGDHCSMGERNVTALPFYARVQGAIKYHHEEANGAGPFGLRAQDTPLYAQIIHVADQIDVLFDLSFITPDKYQQIVTYLKDCSDVRFEACMVDAFCASFDRAALTNMQGERVNMVLREALPDPGRSYSNDELKSLATIFARITDYKSLFTRKHSEGIAQKAEAMGRFYDMDEDTCAKLYLAGALHDIGKLVIDRDVLEKPDRLTDEEYAHIQNHAWYSYDILRGIKGFEDITWWAALHHEKLDGTGYPFGKHDYELNKIERLMGVVDIYQALIEDRPYKEGLPHNRALTILRNMAAEGKIDPDIVEDVDRCFR